MGKQELIYLHHKVVYISLFSGNIVCYNRLSTGARVGIAVAIFIVIFALILGFGYMRRRRIQRLNMTYVNQSQQAAPPYPQQGNFGYYGQGNQGFGDVPQYPPQSYGNKYSPFPESQVQVSSLDYRVRNNLKILFFCSLLLFTQVMRFPVALPQRVFNFSKHVRLTVFWTYL
jgi:hypothetical protein